MQAHLQVACAGLCILSVVFSKISRHMIISSFFWLTAFGRLKSLDYEETVGFTGGIGTIDTSLGRTAMKTGMASLHGSNGHGVGVAGRTGRTLQSSHGTNNGLKRMRCRMTNILLEM